MFSRKAAKVQRNLVAPLREIFQTSGTLALAGCDSWKQKKRKKSKNKIGLTISRSILFLTF
jgi:hypothetical protein